MVALAEKDGISLGQVALAYESALLGIPEGAVLDEMQRRFEVMRAAVERGLGEDLPPMQLLRPSARQIFQAEAAGRLPTGGIHTRAAARAMAVMHVNGGHGVVCAAPTAGAAGVVPAVAVTLAEEWGLGQEQASLALLAASAVGLVLGTRATFAAEVAGCQVEIGAAGAMAAAAVVEAAGGTAQPGPGRRRHLLPEHHGLGLRPGAGHRRDPLPHPQRRRRLVAPLSAPT